MADPNPSEAEEEEVTIGPARGRGLFSDRDRIVEIEVKEKTLVGKKRDIHVVQRDDGWARIKEGAERAGSVHPTQREAIEQAREQAKREKVEVVIHRKRRGLIRDSDSYGNDPFPPKDRVR